MFLSSINVFRACIGKHLGIPSPCRACVGKLTVIGCLIDIEKEEEEEEDWRALGQIESALFWLLVPYNYNALMHCTIDFFFCSYRMAGILEVDVTGILLHK
jgi:hypothetical protein